MIPYQETTTRLEAYQTPSSFLFCFISLPSFLLHPILFCCFSLGELVLQGRLKAGVPWGRPGAQLRVGNLINGRGNVKGHQSIFFFL